MRIRMAAAAAFIAVLLCPSAAAAVGNPPPDGLEWNGHMACATAVFESVTISTAPDKHYLHMAGTATPCSTVKPGDFFAVAYYYPSGVGRASVLVLYDQAPATPFEGTISLTAPLPVCLASSYAVRMACFSIAVSGTDWTAVPLSTSDPSVAVRIASDVRPGDPKCATCWE